MFQSVNKTKGRNEGVIAASSASLQKVRVDTLGDMDANFSLTDTPSSVIPQGGYRTLAGYR